jgi:L-lactate dehydrogenase
MSLKVSIIGAGGRVGSTAAYALQLGGVVREIALIDVFMADQITGEALDLVHGASLTGPLKVTAGGYETLEGSDVVVVTSGLRRQPDEERLALMNRNAEMFRGIVKEIKNAKLKSDTVLLVVSNPVDVLTYIAVKESGLPPAQVLGLGTVLDTCRFRSLLAEKFDVSATDVDALMLGEHGDSMFPVWSSATIAGIPLKSVPGYTEESARAVADRTRTSGAEVIRLKGGAGSAVGVSIRTVVQAILQDTGQVLPVSTLQTGIHGVRELCFSIPTKVGRAGAIQQIEPVLTESEKASLLASAEHLKETLAQVR